MAGKDEADFGSDATNRLTQILERQVRFLYDLAQSREHLATFELRFVSRPQAHGLAQVSIGFLGKTFHPDKHISAQLALNLWDKFSAVFPREAPFSYPLAPVRHLDQAQQVCMVTITLRPQCLTDQEVVILHELAGWYARAACGEVGIDNPLVDVLREQLQIDVFESYTRARADLGKKVYNNLVREHRSLLLVRLQVVGIPFAQDDLVEALGSEIMANASSTYPSRWSRGLLCQLDCGICR